MTPGIVGGQQRIATAQERHDHRGIGYGEGLDQVLDHLDWTFCRMDLLTRLHRGVGEAVIPALFLQHRLALASV